MAVPAATRVTLLGSDERTLEGASAARWHTAEEAAAAFARPFARAALEPGDGRVPGAHSASADVFRVAVRPSAATAGGLATSGVFSTGAAARPERDVVVLDDGDRLSGGGGVP